MFSLVAEKRKIYKSATFLLQQQSSRVQADPGVPTPKFKSRPPYLSPGLNSTQAWTQILGSGLKDQPVL